MKTKLLLLLTFLSLNFTVYSQVCGTTTPQNYQKHNRTKAERGFDKTNIQMHTEICLNVFYHIVRNDNQTGGISPNLVENMTNFINESFSVHNLFFNNLGFDFIDNTAFLSIEDGEEEDLANFGNIDNVINIYIVNNLWTTAAGGIVLGTALSIPSNNLVVDDNFILHEVLIHELGHCLNLIHTFQGTRPNTAGCAELIESTSPNCNDCGDRVCDTPADEGNGNANGFSPDLTNFMSYYPNLDHFTDGQELRMRDAIFAENILQNVTSNSCTPPIITSDNITICEDTLTTFTIENAEPPYNWLVSNNIEIIENNGNSISVTANSSSNSNGLIEATFPGGSFSKEVWIGEPKFEIFINENGGIPWIEVHFLDVLRYWHYRKQGVTETEITYDVDIFNYNENAVSPVYYTYTSSDWTVVTGEISVTNECGTTTIPYILENPECPCQGMPKIIKVGSNKYKVFNSLTDEYEFVTISELYDIYGNIKQVFNANQEEMNINNQSNSGDLRIIKANINGEILTKTIIVD